MKFHALLRPTAVLLAGLFVAACGTADNSGGAGSQSDVGAGSLTGAGSTFVEPFFTKAFYQYNQLYSQVSVNYQSVGSGAGIQQYTKGTVDFGATDVPMSANELQGAGGADTLIQIPAALGVVAITYNLSGVANLQLDGATLANIFLGTVKTWDDPAIKALNSGASLPGKPITVIHRSDGSGTTYAFTDYLSKQSAEWKSKAGVGKSVQWPVGVGASGNAGVGQQVKQTEGAIGYNELAYVMQGGLKAAQLQNKNGKFIKPTLDSASAAAAGNTSVSPDNFSITDQPGDSAYPIATFTWVIIKKAQADATKGKALVNLFKWIVSNEGQALGKDLQYAPLPSSVQSYATSQLKLVMASGAPILT